MNVLTLSSVDQNISSRTRLLNLQLYIAEYWICGFKFSWFATLSGVYGT